MDSLPKLSLAELNALALESFVYQPVDKVMIRYLARAAGGVIQCDPHMMPPAAQSARTREPSPRPVKNGEPDLPTMEDFITQLVISSNVQVPTLMSSLVYLRRLKSRLQPMAKGLRCTTHRIFLAALILAAKYLNDSSPKNKHWANYSLVNMRTSTFGFSRTEVNLMEKQLLFLLDWDLRIEEADLYRELDPFLAPLRAEHEARHERRFRRRMEQELREKALLEERVARMRDREEEARLWARALAAQQQHQQQANADSAPRDTSRSRAAEAYTPSHSRGSSRDVSPPGLVSSASSYAGSSRATTPLGDDELDELEGEEADITTAHQPYVYDASAEVCDSPMEDVYHEQVPSVPEKDAVYMRPRGVKAKQQMLPYEISAEELRSLEEGAAAARERERERGGGRRVRGMLGRVFGAAAAAR